MKKLILIVAALVGAYFWYGHAGQTDSSAGGARSAVRAVLAYGRADSGREVVGQGIVTRVLADDTRGLQHQRFILRLSSGQTVLVAHDISLAPRIPGLHPGQTVAFKGVFVWNRKGGIIHWTHRDPDGSHVAGWLKAGGRTFQ